MIHVTLLVISFGFFILFNKFLNILKEYLLNKKDMGKNESRFIEKNMDCGRSTDKDEPVASESNRKGIEESFSEEDISKIVSSKIRTSVPFGQEET